MGTTIPSFGDCPVPIKLVALIFRLIATLNETISRVDAMLSPCSTVDNLLLLDVKRLKDVSGVKQVFIVRAVTQYVKVYDEIDVLEIGIGQDSSMVPSGNTLLAI